MKSDIPGPSSSRSARSAILRPSPPSTMKVSPIGPSAASLLLNVELAIGAVSSILKDYDLKRSCLLPVEEALALSL